MKIFENIAKKQRKKYRYHAHHIMQFFSVIYMRIKTNILFINILSNSYEFAFFSFSL